MAALTQNCHFHIRATSGEIRECTEFEQSFADTHHLSRRTNSIRWWQQQIVTLWWPSH